ncbi:sugar phosphate isomerase/epimerase family protein [Tardiphaga sp.]|uniref:sugar phosphate isomerase/epimerase family protein n=1 Tax=Tardiphaga sp. TaxID=1926292 RepID=UPI002635F72D|nr:sugar phosphate isomerase/epimerase family protein [Tardiphaga sp.]MDB5616471.1 Xylose isomerase [Tardiphaga sp.]
MARELGINTYGYIWSMSAADCARRLAGLNYRQFEFLLQPPHLPLDDFGAEKRRDLKMVLDDVGAKRTALNLPSLDHNLASPFSRVRAASVQMLADSVDLAGDLGAEWLVVVPGRMSPLFPPSPQDRIDWLTDGVSKLLRRAEARGVGLAIENVPFAGLPDAASLGCFVRSFNSPSIKVCYDAANAHFIGESPADGIRQLADLLRIVHLSDTTRTNWRHDPVGNGDVPFAEVAAALDAVDFDGAVTLEILDHDPDAGILRSHRALTPLGFTQCAPVRSS